MSDPAVIDRALAAAEPAAGRWLPAAREGLEDKRVLQAARDVVELGISVLHQTGAEPELTAATATRLQRIVNDTQERRAS